MTAFTRASRAVASMRGALSATGSRVARRACVHVGGFVLLAGLAWGREGRAQVSAPGPFASGWHRVSLRAELGAAALLSEYQRSALGFDGFGAAGSLRAALWVHPAVGLSLAGANWLFPRGAQLGGVVSLTGGVRVEPAFGSRVRLAIDLEAGLGVTADRPRFLFGGGLGLDLRVAGPLWLGPSLRYGHLVAAEGAVLSGVAQGLTEAPWHAPMLAFGLALALRMPPASGERASVSVGDRDGDRIDDVTDLCPDEPAGARPDVQRHGCPERDRDGDSVLDGDDLCVDVPQGAHADPQRRGCPLPDTDGDGVFDPDDRCVTTPQGANPDPTRRGCPDGDDDNDRVRNAADRCPQQHAGFHPDPTRPGCPLPDEDHDAVPDRDDACATVPGAPSADRRRNGCPGLVRVTDEQIEILRPVFFATNRDTILARSEPVLRAVADALRATRAIARLRVEGHTDDTNDEAFNLALSRRRAETVRAALLALGVEPARLETEGFGEGRPLVSVGALRGPRLERARAQNRRVEFRVLEVRGD